MIEPKLKQKQNKDWLIRLDFYVFNLGYCKHKDIVYNNGNMFACYIYINLVNDSFTVHIFDDRS